MTLSLFLMVLALVLLFLAAIKEVPEPRFLSYGWAGIFLLALTLLVGKI